MAMGALSMGTGFVLLGFSSTALQFYLILSVFIGFGAGAMGQLATSKLVSNWFVLKRGMALGIAATGISLSGVVMPSVSAALITHYGWREGFFSLWLDYTGPGGATGLEVCYIKTRNRRTIARW
jgi:MFS family permease